MDTSNAEIYDLVRILIRVKDLDTTCRLVLKPFESLSVGEPDSVFLENLLIEKRPKQKEKYKTIGSLDKCLTRSDLDYMLRQKSRLHDFQWDSTRLHFTGTRQYDGKYSFSVPLVSADRTKFIISYGGWWGGRTALFKKVNNNWEAQETIGWVY